MSRPQRTRRGGEAVNAPHRDCDENPEPLRSPAARHIIEALAGLGWLD